MTDINKYMQESDCVYFVGNYYSKKVFCKLNTTSNILYYFAEENDEELIMVYLNNMLDDKQIEMYKSFDDFLNEDKDIFEKII